MDITSQISGYKIKKNEPCCFHWLAYSYVSFILFEILVSISVVLSEIQ